MLAHCRRLLATGLTSRHAHASSVKHKTPRGGAKCCQVLGSAVGMCVRARVCVFGLGYGLKLREVLFDCYTDARRIWSSHLSP